MFITQSVEAGGGNKDHNISTYDS